jgi:hypothetical protein
LLPDEVYKVTSIDEVGVPSVRTEKAPEHSSLFCPIEK